MVVPVVAVEDAANVRVVEHVGLQLGGMKPMLMTTPGGSGVVVLKVTGVVTPATNVAVIVSTPVLP